MAKTTNITIKYIKIKEGFYHTIYEYAYVTLKKENIMKIQCPFCKKKFNSIMSHLKVHKISVGNFIEKYPNFKMVSDRTKKICSKTCIKNGVGKQNKGIKRSKGYKKFISKKFSGKGNPFFGKKHSAKTKAKMSRNHADFCGEKNPFKKWYWNQPEDTRNKYKKLCAEKWIVIKNNPKKYQELCERDSERTAILHMDGKCKSYGRGHKHGHFFSKKQNKKLFYRSSYELDFLKICEVDGDIKSFDNAKLRIPYKDKNGFTKNYIPDFVVNNKFIIETKPISLMNYSSNPLKMKYAKDFCKQNNLSYVVFTKRELEIMTQERKVKYEYSVY